MSIDYVFTLEKSDDEVVCYYCGEIIKIENAIVESVGKWRTRYSCVKCDEEVVCYYCGEIIKIENAIVESVGRWRTRYSCVECDEEEGSYDDFDD